MPLSRLIRRIERRMNGGRLWEVWEGRAKQVAPSISPEGWTPVEFADAVLFDVDPALRNEIISLMHRRGIITVQRNRGAMVIYGAAPARRFKPPEAISSSAHGAFVAAVAPHVLQVATQVDDYWKDVACGRIIRLCRAHEHKLALSEQRATLWRLFPADVMQLVSFHEPLLQQGNAKQEFPAVRAKPKRLPPGLDTSGKVQGLIGKAGERGITLTDLVRSVNPRHSSAEIRAIADALVEQGKATSRRMRTADRGGRPGQRYFVNH